MFFTFFSAQGRGRGSPRRRGGGGPARGGGFLPGEGGGGEAGRVCAGNFLGGGGVNICFGAEIPYQA